MKKTNTTRKALFTSVVSLMLCLTMLMGTTFAWFTDTASVQVSKITAGTLDVELWAAHITNGTVGEMSNIGDSDEKLWNDDKWEPGYTSYKVIKIVNAGNLAFEYALDVTTSEEQPVQSFYLHDVIDVYFKIVDTVPTTIAVDEYKTYGEPVSLANVLKGDNDGVVHGVLLPEGKTADGTGYEKVEEAYAIIALHMQESAGNDYQNLIENFDITLWAKQYTEEFDSETDQYDKNAQYETKDNTDRPNNKQEETPATYDVDVTVTLDGKTYFTYKYTDLKVGDTKNISTAEDFTAPENASTDDSLTFTVPEGGMSTYTVAYNTNAPTTFDITVNYTVDGVASVATNTIEDVKAGDIVAVPALTFDYSEYYKADIAQYTVVDGVTEITVNYTKAAKEDLVITSANIIGTNGNGSNSNQYILTDLATGVEITSNANMGGGDGLTIKTTQQYANTNILITIKGSIPEGYTRALRIFPSKGISNYGSNAATPQAITESGQTGEFTAVCEFTIGADATQSLTLKSQPSNSVALPEGLIIYSVEIAYIPSAD